MVAIGRAVLLSDAKHYSAVGFVWQFSLTEPRCSQGTGSKPNRAPEAE